MGIATLVLGGAAALCVWLFWPLAILPIVLWIWVLWFFRDPRRVFLFARGQLCAPADGKVTEISRLQHQEDIGGPAVRIGIFLSAFNVHANRSPCAGRVRWVRYAAGEFLDARDPQSGGRNESNTLLIDPKPPLSGPVIVRQVAGKVARRIVCHVGEGDDVAIGQRFGMIKFGSRTELLLPDGPRTEISIAVGQHVRAGVTVVAAQKAFHNDRAGERRAIDHEVEQPG